MARDRELVKYHNDLNGMPMRNWSAEEMNLFFTVIMEIRDKGTEKIELDANKIKILTGTETRNSYWYSMVDSFAHKAIQLRYREESDNKVQYSALFQRIGFDLEKKTITVRVAEDFEYIVNKLTKNFTVWELKEFTALKSTYSKTMYRILKQWRKVGKLELSIEKFRHMLDIPASYNASSIKRAVIAPIQKELPKYFNNLKVKIMKANTQGTPVIGYRFTWDPETTGEWIEHDKKYSKRYSNGQIKPGEREYDEDFLSQFYIIADDDDALEAPEFDVEKYQNYQEYLDEQAEHLEKDQLHF